MDNESKYKSIRAYLAANPGVPMQKVCRDHKASYSGYRFWLKKQKKLQKLSAAVLDNPLNHGIHVNGNSNGHTSHDTITVELSFSKFVDYCCSKAMDKDEAILDYITQSLPPELQTRLLREMRKRFSNLA